MQIVEGLRGIFSYLKAKVSGEPIVAQDNITYGDERAVDTYDLVYRKWVEDYVGDPNAQIVEGIYVDSTTFTDYDNIPLDLYPETIYVDIAKQSSYYFDTENEVLVPVVGDTSGFVKKSGDIMTGPLSVPLLILRDNQDTPIAEGYYARNNRPYYSNQFAVENELAFVSETLVKTTVGGMDRIIGLKGFNNGVKLGYNKFLGITNEFSMPDAATLPDAYYVFSFRHSMNSGESDITELELKFTPWSIYNSAQPNPITSGKLRIAAMTARNTFYDNRNISVIYEGEELYTPTEIIIGVRESDTSGANYAHKFIAVKANWNGAAAHNEFNPRCKIEVESFKTRITGSAYSLYYATSEALADITDFQTKIDITSYLKIIPTKDTLVQKADPDTFIELLENASPTQITEIKTFLQQEVSDFSFFDKSAVANDTTIISFPIFQNSTIALRKHTTGDIVISVVNGIGDPIILMGTMFSTLSDQSVKRNYYGYSLPTTASYHIKLIETGSLGSNLSLHLEQNGVEVFIISDLKIKDTDECLVKINIQTK